MDIVSWNIQYATGVDELTSPVRITNDIQAFTDADIICLQEVLCTSECDQVAEIAGFFPQHEAYFGAAINRLAEQGRLQFGNLILSRLPVLQVVLHKLPQPAKPESKHMPRQAIEMIVNYKGETLRIVTTHLDYFAEKQRSAQVRYLTDHFKETINRYYHPSPDGGSAQFQSIPETLKTVYTGDFNLTVDSDDYKVMTEQGPTSKLLDCWRLVHGEEPHAPTCGIFDHVQWQEGAHCRDFFFVSQELSSEVTHIEVQTETAASDHQPIKLSLN